MDLLVPLIAGMRSIEVNIMGYMLKLPKSKNFSKKSIMVVSFL